VLRHGHTSVQMQFSDFEIIRGRLFSTVLFCLLLIARNEVTSYSRGRACLRINNQRYNSRYLRDLQLLTSKSHTVTEYLVQQPGSTDPVAPPTSNSLSPYRDVVLGEKSGEIGQQSKTYKIKLTTSQKLERDITALKTFFAIHGHFRVPYYYIIPDEGKADNCTNSRVRRKAKVAVDIPSCDHTITVTSSPSTESKTKKRKSASTTPSSDGKSGAIYPAEVYGLKLGRRVAQIRRREIYIDAEHRERLRAIGMVTYSQSQLDGISEKEQQESRSKFTSDFKREGSAETAEHNHDNTNGKDSSLADSKAVMNELMTSKEHTREIKFLQILSALKVHDNLFGDMLVPRYFIVPSEEPWPEPTWGMQLGNRVRNIRAKSAYNQPRFHKILEESGFLMSLEHVKMPISR
jgi:hypothetical protein